MQCELYSQCTIILLYSCMHALLYWIIRLLNIIVLIIYRRQRVLTYLLRLYMYIQFPLRLCALQKLDEYYIINRSAGFLACAHNTIAADLLQKKKKNNLPKILVVYYTIVYAFTFIVAANEQMQVIRDTLTYC